MVSCLLWWERIVIQDWDGNGVFDSRINRNSWDNRLNHPGLLFSDLWNSLASNPEILQRLFPLGGRCMSHHWWLASYVHPVSGSYINVESERTALLLLSRQLPGSGTRAWFQRSSPLPPWIPTGRAIVGNRRSQNWSPQGHFFSRRCSGASGPQNLCQSRGQRQFRGAASGSICSRATSISRMLCPSGKFSSSGKIAGMFFNELPSVTDLMPLLIASWQPISDSINPKIRLICTNFDNRFIFTP